jgi:hypothetical protein
MARGRAMCLSADVRSRILAVLAALTAPLLAAASPASAADFNCEASALRGTVLGQTLEPVTANRGRPACRPARGGGAGLTDPLAGLPLPVRPVSASLLAAQTNLQGQAGRPVTQTAGAEGGIANVGVLSLPELPVQVIPDQVNQQIEALQPISLLGGTVTVDIRRAVRALLPNGRLPSGDLLRIQGAYSFASARCVGGRPRLTSQSAVTGLRVLGQDLTLNQVVERTLNLVDTTNVDPSNIDLGNVDFVAGSLDAATLRPLLQPVLDGLPTISIPATVARVRVTPGQETRTADRLTRTALRVEASVGPLQLLDVTIGEATVSSAGVSCAESTGTAPQEALRCTQRRVVLIDVLERGGRVRLVGAADPRLAGRTVRIVFRATERTVARARVRRNGSFSTTARLPSRALRSTNRARYQAVVGRERSLDLKLRRRLVITSTRVRGGRVTIRGRVTRPLAGRRSQRRITLVRRVSCRRVQVLRRFLPRRDGTFSVTVPAPPNQSTAVYRLATRVRKVERNPRTYPTFTLPRFVDLT